MPKDTEILEDQPTTIASTSPRTRTTTPGRTRVTVSLTDSNYATLEKMAIAESTVFPRAVNEFLSILIEKNFENLIAK